MRSTFLVRSVTGRNKRDRQDAPDEFKEESPETPLSRVPLGQGKSKTKDSQPESNNLPPGRN
jgi:hypothetical protein